MFTTFAESMLGVARCAIFFVCSLMYRIKIKSGERNATWTMNTISGHDMRVIDQKQAFPFCQSVRGASLSCAIPSTELARSLLYWVNKKRGEPLHSPRPHGGSLFGVHR